MDKASYTFEGITPLPVPQGPRDAQAVRAYRRSCDTRAAALVDDVAPTITAVGFAEVVPMTETRGMAMVLGGDKPREVSRHALALELHEPQEYWDRARVECGAVMERHARFARSNGDPHGYAKAAERTQQALDAKVAEGDSPLGGVRAMNMFAAMLVHPGARYDEKDHKVLAAHALVHARITNRDSLALKAAREDLPEESRWSVDKAIQFNMQSEVMGAVRDLASRDKQGFLEATSVIRDTAWEDIQASAKPTAMTQAVLKGTETVVKDAASTDASDAGIFVKNRTAIRAMMANSAVADGPFLGLLAVDIASRKVETREASIAQVMAPKTPRTSDLDRG